MGDIFFCIVTCILSNKRKVELTCSKSDITDLPKNTKNSGYSFMYKKFSRNTKPRALYIPIRGSILYLPILANHFVISSMSANKNIDNTNIPLANELLIYDNIIPHSINPNQLAACFHEAILHPYISRQIPIKTSISFVTTMEVFCMP